MTAAELEAGLDRVCEYDEPPGPDESGDFEPFTPDELAEIREAAADELLAVEVAATGRRGPGQPGSARVFPGVSEAELAGADLHHRTHPLPHLTVRLTKSARGRTLSAGEVERFGFQERT
jgi:hypothetical protein